MTVRLALDGTIELDGMCPIEDAEKLQQCLLADPQATVDWRSCTAAHTAVIQILLAAEVNVRGPPQSDFLCNQVAPSLNQPAGLAPRSAPGR
jgi:hypothetical protein